MMRCLSTAAALAVAGFTLAVAGCDRGAGTPRAAAVQPRAEAQPAQGKVDEGWVTLKGRIVWGGKDIPKREKLKVTTDMQHCLEKGDLYDDSLLVNPKNKGIKNAFVWLAQPPGQEDTPLPIHPGLKDVKDKEVMLDQPRCQFVPRALAMREGQILVAKNSSPVSHNVKWTGDGVNNEGGNPTLPAGKSTSIKLNAQKRPVLIECGIHGWMKARVMVFNHPYYAITDDDGNFEIKLAPAGKYRLFINQEAIGWRGGVKGRDGEEVHLKPGKVLDLGELPMGGE